MTETSKVESPNIYASDARLPQGIKRVDILENTLRELFFIEHPKFEKNSREGQQEFEHYLAKANRHGIWIYYPWLQTAIRTPDEETYLRVRTARNRNLITEEEQQMYRESVVGIAGLSVGSLALAALVATGGPKRLKLADPDTIEATNLNRIRARLVDVGRNKAEVAARNVWEVDPFANIELWTDGVTEATLERFVTRPSLHVFVDEMDDIQLKFISREHCKKAGIPVVMATDTADGAIVDIERFDLEPERPLFHGRIFHQTAGNTMDRTSFVKMAKEIIDPRLFSARQLESIAAVGKTLAGIPQLGSAAMIAGAAVAYAVRTIVTGKTLPSGRYLLDCERTFSNIISA